MGLFKDEFEIAIKNEKLGEEISEKIKEIINKHIEEFRKDLFEEEVEKGLNAIDISFFLNHSNEPNMVAIKEGEEFVAKRDIKTGEELTVDYDTYDDVGLN